MSETTQEDMMDELQMGELIPVADFAAGGEASGDVVPVQIMRVGTFTEMHGREVEITEDDLDKYVANFETGIAGQELPVFQGHPAAATRAGEPAAAWFKKLYTKTVDGLKTLWADIQLTDLGRELLEGGLFKYLSPTIEMSKKLIRGGGFVNLPAIKGQPAIEMAQFLQEVEDPTLMERMGKALNYFMEWSEKRKRGAEDDSVRDFFGLAEFASKTDDGKEYPSRCYLSMPAADKPSTWGLRICEYVDGSPKITVQQLGRAAAALGPGFRGRKYQAKKGESIETLKRKLAALYRKQGVEKDDIPKYIEGGEDMAMTDEQMGELREQIRGELEADFAQRQQEMADLKENIRKEEREKVVAELTERHALEADLAEFAGEVCSGDAGLSTPQDEIVAFLAGLDEEQRDQAKVLLKAKVVDFSEHGHTGSGTQKDKLPEAMEAALRQYLAGRTDIAEAVALFCEANAIEVEDFDLGEFLPRE